MWQRFLAVICVLCALGAGEAEAIKARVDDALGESNRGGRKVAQVQWIELDGEPREILLRITTRVDQGDTPAKVRENALADLRTVLMAVQNEWGWQNVQIILQYPQDPEPGAPAGIVREGQIISATYTSVWVRKTRLEEKTPEEILAAADLREVHPKYR
jgi:hypothetical protein